MNRAPTGMTGIRSIGVHIPTFRLARTEILRAWGQGDGAASAKGERSVAYFDEDTATMAVDAALACLEAAGSKPDLAYFASTTSPYGEKQTASLLAAVLDLGENVRTADFGGSLRAGSSALLAALDAVESGSAKEALIAASDIRLSEPGSSLEHLLGDGAAAALVSREKPILEVEARVSLTREFFDVWRTREDRFLRRDDEKFSLTHGYLETIQAAVRRIVAVAKCKPEEIQHAVVYAQDAGAYRSLVRQLGLSEKAFAEPLFENLGDAGAASVFLQLARLLEKAKPEERILWIAYGDGADAVLFRATEELVRFKPADTVSHHLARRIPLQSYSKYLKYRDLLESRKGLWSLEPFTSIPILWREQRQNLCLEAGRCACSAIAFPRKRVCSQCGKKDQFTPFKLGRKGKVMTFTRDHVYPGPESPTVMVVVDLEGGGRFYTQLTDCLPEDAAIDLPVELVLRKLHEAKGIHHYFWKARPQRS